MQQPLHNQVLFRLPPNISPSLFLPLRLEGNSILYWSTVPLVSLYTNLFFITEERGDAETSVSKTSLWLHLYQKSLNYSKSPTSQNPNSFLSMTWKALPYPTLPTFFSSSSTLLFTISYVLALQGIYSSIKMPILFLQAFSMLVTLTRMTFPKLPVWAMCISYSIC